MCDGSPPQHMTAQVVNSGEEKNSKWLCLLSIPSYPLKDCRVPVNKKRLDLPCSCRNWELGYWILGMGNGC